MSPVNIIRWIAVALAVVAAFVTNIPYVGLIMVILGAVLGFMGVAKEDRVAYLVAAVALAQVATVFGVIPAVGMYIAAIMTNLST
ncbi:MAG: hypothetical protein R3348_09235, partial [Xanthomonadales bacterium]|nr:hypothetical protein [Xanthomonadales bacterium]